MMLAMTLRTLLLSTSVLALSACVARAPEPQAMDGMDHSMHSDNNSQGMASSHLGDNSPRHQEWVSVKSGDRDIRTFVVYPQTSEKVPVVLAIHENKGLNDWARGMADQIAEAGYIAVAPDLLSDFSETETSTEDFATPDDATKAIGQLDPSQVASDLEAVAEWAKTIPSANGKMASAGFCWGGSRSFDLAAASDDLDMAMVFYGTGPTDASVYADIDVPVVAFYGGADERVNATIQASEDAMKAEGKMYDYEIYEGAGHAFMRLGEDPSGTPENRTARNEAWERMKQKLSEL